MTLQLTSWHDKPSTPQITGRALLSGLFIGSIVLISNFQFGLQTGWVSMMSLPSALLGYAIFKSIQKRLDYQFTDVENVFVQSVAVAVGTGPLAYGLVGIVPAIEKFMTKDESGTGVRITFSLLQLMIWSMGLAFFGVFFAIPLRKQVIVKEKLPFPSGSATATLISVLHKTQLLREHVEEFSEESEDEHRMTVIDSRDVEDPFSQEYSANIKKLLSAFTVSSSYTVVSYFIPLLKRLPIFGTNAARALWEFQPSPAYIGQGMIMGLPTVSYMLFGAVLGWAVLAPLANHFEWATGPIDDWKTGGQGWILWISLSVMIADSIVSFLVASTTSFVGLVRNYRSRSPYFEEAGSLIPDAHVEPNSRTGQQKESRIVEMEKTHLVSSKVTLSGIVGSSLLCICCMRLIFGSTVPIYSLVIAIMLAFIFSVLGVRALGETDLNPVSGIGKLSQLIFAVVIPRSHPGSVLINLVAGGIAEAGAQQAGDLMQDLKTGHLLGASPKAQFVAQMVGTVYSVFLSSIIYKVYNHVYSIPDKVFRIPTAVVWMDCSRLVTGGELPPRALEVSLWLGLVFAVISLVKNLTPTDHAFKRFCVYLPSGVAVGIGIYNTPSFTIARFLGGLVSYFWMKKSDNKAQVAMIIFSSGLVLGEGLFSIVTMIFTALKVPQF